MRVYFDNAATTPMAPEVIEAMLPFLYTHFGNPSAIHSYGRETRAAIEKARKLIAGVFHVSPGEIFFTSGGTESNNMAIQCSVRDLGVTHVISSPIEHHAVTHTLEALEHEGKITTALVKLHRDGSVNYEDLEILLKNAPGKTLVSLMHANNEIGILLDIDRVSALCQEYHALFHCDTVQTIGHYAIDLKKTKIHFLSAAAHKFHGPKGIGFIYINADVPIKPLIYGGAQERNMRAGTENLYGIIGLARALELCYAQLENHAEYICGIRDYMKQRLLEEIPGVGFNSKDEGLYTVLNVRFPSNPKAELFLFNLDIAGIAASGGSACTSGSNVGSHVIAQLNNDPDTISVRFSFSKYNTREEVDFVVSKLREMVLVAV